MQTTPADAATESASSSRERGGRLRFVGTFPDEDSILSWLLTFGDGAELLEPPALRTRLRQLGEALARQYQDSQDPQNPKEASPWHPTKRL